MRPDVVVVGAGIIGAACAQALHRRGLEVLVIDRHGPASGTSAAGEGNVLVSDKEPGPELELAQSSRCTLAGAGRRCRVGGKGRARRRHDRGRRRAAEGVRRQAAGSGHRRVRAHGRRSPDPRTAPQPGHHRRGPLPAGRSAQPGQGDESPAARHQDHRRRGVHNGRPKRHHVGRRDPLRRRRERHRAVGAGTSASTCCRAGASSWSPPRSPARSGTRSTTRTTSARSRAATRTCRRPGSSSRPRRARC